MIRLSLVNELKVTKKVLLRKMPAVMSISILLSSEQGSEMIIL